MSRSISWSRLALVILITRLSWGDANRAGYKIPENAPLAAVHPDVLDLQSSFAAVAELVKPAVVSISTVRVEQLQPSPQFYFGDPLEQFFDQFLDPYSRRAPEPRQARKFKMEGVGSGVIIDPDGLVLTNEHVVHDADEIKVLLYDKDAIKTEYVGKVVGKDARTDLAVIRIHAGKKLPFAALGDSSKVRVGDWAIAIGSPFALAQTVTVGVISADRQSLSIEDKEYRNLIQTDAAINRGNSGGPLLNIRGEVVGINTAIYAPTGVFAGIGFAIPINEAKAILDDLVHKGRVVRGWLGVELAQEISPAMVKAFGLSNTQGALVNSVLSGSPAEKSGLRRGDIILSFDGKPVDTPEKLQEFVAQTLPKKSVPLGVLRNRRKVELSLTLGERPDSADSDDQDQKPASKKNAPSTEKSWMGAKIHAWNAELAENFRQPADARGVLVMDVDPESQADEMGLAPGDIIRAINQDPTPDLSSFAAVSGRAKTSEGIVLDILRQGRPLYLSYTSSR